MGILKQQLMEREQALLDEQFPTMAARARDPIRWEVLCTRLQGLVQNARESAKLISASPVVREMGECIFALFTPEGDSVCFSTGLLLHVASMGGAVKFMLDNDYEETVGIRHGDYFFNNDPYLGGAHAPDQMILTPIFHQDQLIGWAGGLTHIPEIGAKEPGGAPPTACSRFEEGIFLPCIKIAENDQIRRDLEMIIERGTRTPIWWLLDNRAKMAGIRMIRDGVIRLIQEFGLDFFQQATYEYIEDTRVACQRKIEKVFFPGTYRSAVFYDVPNANKPVLYPEDYEGRVSVQMEVDPQGIITLDFEGTSPAGMHAFNSSRPATLGNLHSVFIQYVLHDVKYNQGIVQSVLHPNRVKLPPSTINPPSITYACGLWGPGAGSIVNTVALECISRAYYARGFREEVSSHKPGAGGSLRWAGMDQYGRPTAGQNFEMACKGMAAAAVMDGLDTAIAHFNPEGDMSDAEIWERVFPFVWLGRGIVVDGGGAGKYKGGGSIESLYVVEHVDTMQISTPLTHSKVFHSAGLMGGYPPICGGQSYYFDTDFREAALSHAPIPHGEGEDPSRPSWLHLLTGRPNQDDAMPTRMTRRHDLISVNHGGAGGYGDPIERDPEQVAHDLRQGLTTTRTARHVHGVVVAPQTETVDTPTTADLREKLRGQRRARGVPAARYVEDQRAHILAGELPDIARQCLNQCLATSERFCAEFRTAWGLPADFRQVPIRALDRDKQGERR